MLYYVLLGLCFALVGIAGLQFIYMFYIDRLDRERKKRIVELERRCKELSAKLSQAEYRIAEQKEVIENLDVFDGHGEETWADVIEEN
jgi:hypothetical protein